MNPLGDFLRARRAGLDPDGVGLVSYGARRVPGLRREELAQLAGVSPAYYTRLEQGQATGASDAVLDSLAHALRLDADEAAHLRALAHPAPRRRPPARRSKLPGALGLVVASVTEVPVLVADRRFDVLAWNPAAHALLAGHLPAGSPGAAVRPNLLRLVFTDAHTRELYPAWEEEARRAVASARLQAGAGEDRAMSELVGDLAIASPEFAALWARHPVAACTDGTKRFHHPSVGPLELSFTMTQDGAGHRLQMFAAEPGSPSEAALSLLRQDLPVPGDRAGDPVRQ